ncbi:MAG TPA: hypothetical protein P5266_05200, partial [Candidatus Fermentibacter sp.]|nr:hypothetical protein [Candidatus Fermentibacter sp.]
AALELARVLSCAQHGAWNCPCKDCRLHRLIAHPDLLLFGKRSFPEELPVAREFLARSPSQASAFIFYRAARKLLERFDPALWAGEETRLAKAAPLVQAVELGLDALKPEQPGSRGPEALESADSLVSACADLEALCPDQPPVFMIRGMELWARLAPSGRTKVAIIENADRMQDSSRNAMLKILEEPPGTVKFILLSSRRASMMATVLSRSRVYAFEQRTASQAAEVASRVFKVEGVENLVEYFESRTPFPPSAARAEAEAFVGRLLADRAAAGAGCRSALAAGLADAAENEGLGMGEILERIRQKTSSFGAKDKSLSFSFIRFMRALAALYSRLLADSTGDPGFLSLLDEWSRLTRETALQYSSLNRNPELLLEVLAEACGASR